MQEEPYKFNKYFAAGAEVHVFKCLASGRPDAHKLESLVNISPLCNVERCDQQQPLKTARFLVGSLRKDL